MVIDGCRYLYIYLIEVWFVSSSSELGVTISIQSNARKRTGQSTVIRFYIFVLLWLKIHVPKLPFYQLSANRNIPRSPPRVLIGRNQARDVMNRSSFGNC